MQNFQKLAVGINTMPLLNQILRQPELWDAHTFRTGFPNSTMRDSHDILVRFPDLAYLGDQQSQDALLKFYNDTKPVWYPAYEKLPALKPLLVDFMHKFECYSIGRVIIAKMRPGKGFHPHADVDGAYVNNTKGARFHLVLQGQPGNMVRCGDETVSMHTGELWWFNTRLEHEGMNNSIDDRIHLLADFEFF